jgi:PEP-CTERM motif
MKNYAFILAVAAASISVPASAATLVIGAGTGGNCFPFGCSGPSSGNYQQVYNKTGFSGPITITAVQFARDTTLGAGPANLGNYTLSVSTTAAAVDALSPVYAANIGGNNTQVFNGTLASSYDGTLLTLTFSTPFIYNPAGGNLLLDFVISNPTNSSSIFFKADNGNAGGVYSRMQNFGSGTTGYGLQTTFIYGNAVGAVPEPATWAMMLAGFGIVGGTMRYRRRKMSVSFG